MADAAKPHTHTAYAYQRKGKKFGHLLEVGTGRIDADRNIVHVFMNRQPIGGYTGYVVLAPVGMKPPPAQLQPQRPDDDGDEEAEG